MVRNVQLIGGGSNTYAHLELAHDGDDWLLGGNLGEVALRNLPNHA